MGYKNQKNEKGQVALFIVFFVMMLMLFVGMFLMNIIIAQTKIVKNTLNSTQAFYFADMGAERTLWGIKSATGFNKIKLSDYSNGVEINPEGRSIVNPDGVAVIEYKTYKIEVTDPDVLGIKSMGSFKGTARSVELAW